MGGNTPLPLGELCELITKGTTPTTLGFDFTSDGIGFLRVQNISEGKVNFESDTLFISTETHTALKRSQIQAGDVLVSIAGTIGRAGVVPINAPQLNCNQAVAILRPGALINRNYLRHWLESSNAQAQMQGSTVTGTISNLSLSQLGNLVVPLPPLPEQRRIAEILERAEELRRKRKESVRKLTSFIRAIYHDMFDDPHSNHGKWPRKSLKQLGRVKTGSTPPSAKSGMFNGPIPFLTPGDLESEQPVKRSLTEAGSLEVEVVRKGATLVCCIGATIGKIGTAPENCAFNQQINAVEWSSEIDDSYGFGTLQLFRAKIAEWGASTTLPILKKSLFEQIEIPIPPLPLQQEFARRIAAVEKLKAAHRACLTEFDALFASLQHRAFRGEL